MCSSYFKRMGAQIATVSCFPRGSASARVLITNELLTSDALPLLDSLAEDAPVEPPDGTKNPSRTSPIQKKTCRGGGPILDAIPVSLGSGANLDLRMLIGGYRGAAWRAQTLQKRLVACVDPVPATEVWTLTSNLLACLPQRSVAKWSVVRVRLPSDD